jgi:hypothetical protein
MNKRSIYYTQGLVAFTISVGGVTAVYPADNDKPAHHEAATEPVTHDTSGVADPSRTAKPLELWAGGVSLQFGGFVKLDAMQDFDPIGNEDQFKVNSIPVSGDPDSLLGGSSHMTARATRFTLDVRSTEGASQGMRAYVEGDFFGSGNSFRMRHGYGEWNGFLAGQTWTTFQDISARPFSLDYEGPDGEVFVRQAQVRYTSTVSDSFQWSVAAEDADSQITVLGGIAGSGRSELPDLAGTLRFSSARGHVQVGGLLRQLRFVSTGSGVDQTETGYGINISGSANMAGSDAIMGQIAFGTGVGRYIESFGGTNSDAVMTAAGSLEAIDAWAAVAGYTHHWNQSWNSTFSASIAELDDIAGQAGSDIKSARSMHVNLVYKPFAQFFVGGELMWGERENNDGAEGDALRLQVSAQYSFH